jgi:hypothetical protein
MFWSLTISDDFELRRGRRGFGEQKRSKCIRLELGLIVI